jgi:hemolysin III
VAFGASLALGPGFPERLALLLCAASQTALFATSALYHSMPWRPRAEARMQRADHAMIHVKIAGTLTAITWLAGPALWSTALVAAAWAVAVAGAAHKAWVPQIAEEPSIRVQVGQSLLGVPAMVAFALHESGLQLALLVGGGLLYLAGALCFAARRPVLWPRVFSFHEVFHVCVLAGSGAHFALLARALAP